MSISDKWFFICNPIANGGKMKKDWDEVVLELESQGIEYDFIFTQYNNHAIQITMDKISEGYRKFAVVGGDGSINEVVNGFFMQNEVAPSELILGLLPLGTANDWSRTQQIPSNIKESIALLSNGIIKQQDVGLAEYSKDGEMKKRYFNNVAGMSYDAFVAKYLEDHGGSEFSQWKYIFYVLRCLFLFRLPKGKVSWDDQIIDEKLYTINIGICKYNGGGLRLVPHAIPDDGKLALTVAKKLSKLKVIFNMYRFYLGTIGKLKQVITTHTEEVLVEQSGEEKILLELDGEFMGYAPAKFIVLPRALSFISNPEV